MEQEQLEYRALTFSELEAMLTISRLPRSSKMQWRGACPMCPRESEPAEDLFQPFTHAKTCDVILEKTPAVEPYPIFMCDVKWCGHDSRGNPTWVQTRDGTRMVLDEVPSVAPLYKRGASKNGHA